MADDTYVVDEAATGGSTIQIADDGSGIDWLKIDGTYADSTSITLSWSSSSGEATAASGIYWVGGFGSRLIVSGQIENVMGSDGSDYIQGNELANEIWGDHGTDTGQRDTIEAAAGDDTILAGLGDDTVSGGEGADSIQGNAGADTISGNAGADTVAGGAGADSLSGGSDAGDTVSYADSAAAVTVLITHGATTLGQGGDAQGDSLYGFTDVIGSEFNDVITDTVADTIAFGYNDNAFFGLGGKDKLTLGGGNDLAFGGNGGDAAAGGEGDDTLDGGAGNDKLKGGAGHDSLIGAKGTDRLEGAGGADTLTGGAQADTLIGGDGADSLLGGADADLFVFQATTDSTAGNRDTLADFDAAQGDLIDLSAIDAAAGDPGDQEFTLITTAFTGQAGELRVKSTTGGVLVQADVTGDGSADLVIFVAGVSGLAAENFVL